MHWRTKPPIRPFSSKHDFQCSSTASIVLSGKGDTFRLRRHLKTDQFQVGGARNCASGGVHTLPKRPRPRPKAQPEAESDRKDDASLYRPQKHREYANPVAAT